MELCSSQNILEYLATLRIISSKNLIISKELVKSLQRLTLFNTRLSKHVLHKYFWMQLTQKKNNKTRKKTKKKNKSKIIVCDLKSTIKLDFCVPLGNIVRRFETF